MTDEAGQPGGDAGSGPHEPGGNPGRREGDPVATEVMRARLRRLESRLEPLLASLEGTGSAAVRTARHVPAWRRASEGEPRWPVTIAVAGMIALQLSLPTRLSLTGRWILPLIEAVILGVLIASNPRRISKRSPMLRVLGLALIGVASLANAWAVVGLVAGIAKGTDGASAGPLLVTGGSIWLTNVIIFALWYWELDRGGPVSRAHALDVEPDFLFPEMTAPELADPTWTPYFVDYLYVAFTNATAFSPTDTLPFTRWAKLAMMLQAAISLATGALVIARAVNILR